MMKVDQHFPPQKPPMSLGAKSPAETVAAYLRDLASRGLGCTTNIHSLAMAVNMRVEVVRQAKKGLIASGRLKGKYPGQLVSIDGIRFGVIPCDDVETCKTVLRKFYATVCDVRTIDDPGHVPKGRATHLLVGLRRMTIADALRLATRLSEKD